MIYGSGSEQPTVNVPTSKKERLSFVLNDEAILQLARWAVAIEEHYGCPMDMEWARDGKNGKLFIVQARPETVQSTRQTSMFKSYTILRKGEKLAQGLSIGDAVASGRVCLIETSQDIGKFIDGSVLVTSTTDPDWVPIMKRAAAIVTDHGGRTSHAAIVSRELGLPAIVGTGNATEILHSGQDVTVSCAEGEDGFIYDGIGDYKETTLDVASLPKPRRKSCSTWQIRLRHSGGGACQPMGSGWPVWNSSSAMPSASIRWRLSATITSKTRRPRAKSHRSLKAIQTNRNISLITSRAGLLELPPPCIQNP